jgi:RluA family pseudouridine synthase
VSAVIKLSSPATREFWEIPVLFEDDHLLALNKPPLLLGSPDRFDPARPNLLKLLHQGIADRKPWATERGLHYLMNAHRLDSEASGILLLAKSRPVLVAMASLFGSEKPLKSYIALVQGAPNGDRFEVNAKLAPHPARPGLVRVDQRNGKRSRTLVEVRERFSGYALVECRPLTDRPHQIRAHLRQARMPVVGDALYGGGPLLLSRLKSDYRLKPGKLERPLVATAALHAERLSLPHPVTGALVEITAPWRKELIVAVKYLRRYAPAGGSSKLKAQSSREW